MEYLSRAAMCAKSCTRGGVSDARDGEFLHELEEKLDVARLQLQICEALGRHGTMEAREAVVRLNSQLFDITAVGFHVFLVRILCFMVKKLLLNKFPKNAFFPVDFVERKFES